MRKDTTTGKLKITYFKTGPWLAFYNDKIFIFEVYVQISATKNL